MLDDPATLARSRTEAVLRAWSRATEVAGLGMVEGANFIGARCRKHADHYHALASAGSLNEALALNATFLRDAPAGIISCATLPSKQGTDELMRHKDTKLILATGGNAMVHAAYSSGAHSGTAGLFSGSSHTRKSTGLRMTEMFGRPVSAARTNRSSAA